MLKGNKMEPDVIIKIAGLGLLLAIICQILTKAGREDMATLATVAGIIVVLFTIVDLAADLINRVQDVFLYP